MSLIDEFKSLQPGLIVAETTGWSKSILALHMATSDLLIFIVNPQHVPAFAKAVVLFAKTEAIDARVLPRYEAAIKPWNRPIKIEDRQQYA